MQFHKWCLFLIRIMSPRVVGLIYFFLFISVTASIVTAHKTDQILLSKQPPLHPVALTSHNYTDNNRKHLKSNSSVHRFRNEINSSVSVLGNERTNAANLAFDEEITPSTTAILLPVDEHSKTNVHSRNLNSNNQFPMSKSDAEYLLNFFEEEFAFEGNWEGESRQRVKEILNDLRSLVQVRDSSDIVSGTNIYKSEDQNLKERNDNYRTNKTRAVTLPSNKNFTVNNSNESKVLSQPTSKVNSNFVKHLDEYGKDMLDNEYLSSYVPFISSFLKRPNGRSMSIQDDVAIIPNKYGNHFPNDSPKMDSIQKTLINNYVKGDLIHYNFRNISINRNPANERERNSKSLYQNDFFVEPVTIPYKSYESFPENGRISENLTIYEILKPRLRSPKKLEHQIEVSTESKTNIISSDRTKSSMQYENKSSTPTDFPEKKSNGSDEFFSSLVTASERSDSDYVFGVTSERSENSSETTTVIGTSEIVFDYQMNTNSSKAYVEHDDMKIKIDSLTARIAETPLVNSGKLKIDKYNKQVNETISSFGINRNTSFRKNSFDSLPNFYELKNIQESNSTNGTDTTAMDAMAMDASDVITQKYDPDLLRQPKMTDTVNVDNASLKNPKLDPKSFYDYFSKKMYTNASVLELPFPEYRPGNLYRYSDIYQRKPVVDVVYTRPTPVFEIFRPKTTTEEAPISSTTFDSIRTSVRVASTFYPNRIQDVTMVFGNPPATVSSQKPQNRNDEDPDDDEYRDLLDPGFTMEKLAYLLIGTCCGLSILCLCVVVIAIKCRRVVVERRLKSRFRKRMYHPDRMKDQSSPWQQQMFDHLMYFRRQPGDSSCSSAATDCNCRCVTWSLGPRNLESSNSSSRPMCGPNNRNSLYLCGQKKLPFGAASTLRYESMLGRNKKPIPSVYKNRESPPNTDSSHENDSLDQDSQDSREGGVVHCTCIDYNVWPLTPGDVRRGFYGLYPGAGRYNIGECVQHPAVELRTIAKDIPPPVTGSNYLDRSEGVVYWSSNDERLI